MDPISEKLANLTQLVKQQFVANPPRRTNRREPTEADVSADAVDSRKASCLSCLVLCFQHRFILPFHDVP